MDKSVDLAETEPLPAWLQDALCNQVEFGRFESGAEAVPPCPADFLERCHAAAQVAFSLKMLEQARERLGFQPFGPVDYLRGLARAADIPLGPVLEHFRIPESREVTPSSAAAFAGLARRVGMALRQVLLHVRIGFLAAIDPAPLSMLLAARRSRGGHSDLIADSQNLLAEAESEMPLETLSKLRAVEFAVNATFTDGL